MAQNVNPASSSSSGYEKDAMERNSATSSSQVRIYGRPGRLWGQFFEPYFGYNCTTKHGPTNSNCFSKN